MEINLNWDLQSLYPNGLHSEKLQNLLKVTSHELNDLSVSLKNFTQSVGEAESYVNQIVKADQLLCKIRELEDYIYCVYAKDVKDIETRKVNEHIQQLVMEYNQVFVRFQSFLGNIPDNIWDQLKERVELTPMRYYLQSNRELAKDALPPKEEKLIQILSTNGIKGWREHYIMFITSLYLEHDDRKMTITDAYITLLSPITRDEKEVLAKKLSQLYKDHADVLASILNQFTGSRLEIYKARGWDELLTEFSQQNKVSISTVDALLESIEEVKSDFQLFYEQRSRLLNIEDLKWFDVFSPIHTPELKWSLEEAFILLTQQFNEFDQELGEFVQMSIHKNWIDTMKDQNKLPGAFCASLPYSKESRILSSFDEQYQDVVTLAHELGHAIHNNFLHKQPAFAQEIGTALAETASTFMENLVLDRAIEQATSIEDTLSLLEYKIMNGLKYVASVPAMFQFEKELYQKRKLGPISTDEIVALITKWDKFYNGDRHSITDPYRWMVIAHLYEPNKAFFNIPYGIGYLFSNGLYQVYKEQKDIFPERLKQLLRNSGTMSLEELANEYIGVDMSSTSFWKKALMPVSEAIKDYVKISNELTQK